MQIQKTQIRYFLTDIRFWLILFFLIRLTGITNAPLEVAHNWRQSLTNMMTRNFVDNGVDMLHPTIDMAGEKTGIIGSEFPIFNFLNYLFDIVFGYSHWIGRLINLFVTTFGIYYFYRLIKHLIDERTAFSATIVLSTSLFFAYSRKIMPDTFSVSLMLAGLYYFAMYLKNGKILQLLLFFTLSTLGMLSKIPVLSLFSVVAVALLIKEIPLRRRIAAGSFAAAGFGIVALWYFYWVPYLVATYHYQLYFPKGFAEGLGEIKPMIPQLLEKFYFTALCSYVAFACMLVGIVLLAKSQLRFLKVALLLITLVFFAFIIKTGDVFPKHSYYIIPFIPVMALLVGYFLSQIPQKIAIVLLGVIAIEGIANQQHDFFVRDSQKYKLGLENTLNKFVTPDEKIILNGGDSPQDMYFSHRKGWTVGYNEVADSVFVDSLANLGASFLVVDLTHYSEPICYRKALYSDEFYSIFRLSQSKETP